MSLVGAEYWFTWALVGAPVNTHDSALLKSIDLWKIIVGGEIIPDVVQQLEDIYIQPLILGDGTFLLWTFMLKPHGDAILPDGTWYFGNRNSRL